MFVHLLDLEAFVFKAYLKSVRTKYLMAFSILGFGFIN